MKKTEKIINTLKSFVEDAVMLTTDTLSDNYSYELGHRNVSVESADNALYLNLYYSKVYDSETDTESKFEITIKKIS